jgi:hypothetical protein
MYYYRVVSSHWTEIYEFKSKTKMDLNQCFKIIDHNGTRKYPTRFKVVSVSLIPTYSDSMVEVFSMDLTVDKF